MFTMTGEYICTIMYRSNIRSTQFFLHDINITNWLHSLTQKSGKSIDNRVYLQLQNKSSYLYSKIYELCWCRDEAWNHKADAAACLSYLLALANVFSPGLCGLECREHVSVESAVQSQIPQTGGGQNTFPLQDIAEQLWTEWKPELHFKNKNNNNNNNILTTLHIPSHRTKTASGRISRDSHSCSPMHWTKKTQYFYSNTLHNIDSTNGLQSEQLCNILFGVEWKEDVFIQSTSGP